MGLEQELVLIEAVSDGPHVTSQWMVAAAECVVNHPFVGRGAVRHVTPSAPAASSWRLTARLTVMRLTTEVLSDGLHAIGAGATRLGHRAITVGIAGGVVRQRLCQDTALALRGLSAASALVALHQNRLETPLKQVPDPPVRAVDILREHAVELTHTLGEVRIRRLDQQVVMVGHQAISVNHLIEALAGRRQQDRETRRGRCRRRRERCASLVTACRPVIQRTGKLQP